MGTAVWYLPPMHRIRLLTLGMVLAVFVGVVLTVTWNFVMGIVLGVAIFVSFAIAAFIRSGPGWSHDEDDARDSWNRRMR
jgi:hypothetical protein